MMKLFRRKSKETESVAPVEVTEGSPTSEAVVPVSVNGGSAGATRSWPDPFPVMFAPPWAIDEMIRVEEYSQDGTLVMRAELPGIDPEEDIRLTVANGRLVIEAERHEHDEVERDGFMLRELRYGTFSRSLPLAPGVTAASITATYKDGLLEVRIPSPAATPAQPPERIPVTTS